MVPMIVLVCLPLVLGVIVCAGLGALDRTSVPVRGISPSYFASVALMFGLFASLVAGEAWQRVSKTNLDLATEVSGLRAMMRIAEVIEPDSRVVHNAAQDYARTVKAQELGPRTDGNLENHPSTALHRLYAIGVDGSFFRGESPANSAYLAALESVRASRLQRLELRHGHTPTPNFVILFCLGLLTQIAIGFSHGGNQRATNYSVGLFSLAFACSIYFIASFDHFYEHGQLINAAVLDDVD
jgi:hypothetical protein